MADNDAKGTKQATNGRHDVHTHRMIAGGLVLTVISAEAAITHLASVGKTCPEVLTHLAMGALGALCMATSAVMGSKHPAKREGE